MSYNFWQLRVWGLKSLMRVNSRAASHNRFRSSPYYFATKENPSLQFFIDVHCLVGDAWGPLFVPGPNSSVQSPFAVPAPLPCTFKKPLRTTHQCAFAPACEHLHFYKTLLTSTWWHVIQSLRWLFKAIFCTWPARVCSRCHASSFSSKLTGCTSPWRRLSGDRGAESGGSEGGEHGAPRRWGAEGGESEDPPWDAWTQHHGEPHGVLLPGWIQPHPWDPGESAAVKWDHRYALLCVFAFQRVSSSAQFTPSIHVQWKRPRRNQTHPYGFI